MAELSDDTRGLLEETRDAFEPTAQQRASVQWALGRRMANSGGRASFRGWRSLRVVGAGLALATTAAAFGMVALSARPTPALVSDVAPAPPAPALGRSRGLAGVSPESAPAPVGAEREAARALDEGAPASLAKGRGATAPRSGKSPAAQGRRDTVGDEAALLLEANAARQGDPAKALALLRIYESRYGRGGALGEEHAAAEILALCSAGEAERAARRLASFARTYPRSPQLGALRRSCAGK